MNNFLRIWFQSFRQFSNLFSQIRLQKRHTSFFNGICREILTYFMKNSRRNVDDFWLKFWDLSGAKICKSCISRHELSNEYLLAKIGVDTAEITRPSKFGGKYSILFSLVSLAPPRRGAGGGCPSFARRSRRSSAESCCAEITSRVLFLKIWQVLQNFAKKCMAH